MYDISSNKQDWHQTSVLVLTLRLGLITIVGLGLFFIVRQRVRLGVHATALGMVKSYTKIADSTGGFGTLTDGDEFGWSVTNIGDLNQDGIPDMVAGARYDDTGGDSRGAIYILFMNVDGTVTSTQKIANNTGGFGTLNNEDNFGCTVASIGDLNRDGISDLAVGAVYDDTGGANRGAVYVLFMQTDGTVNSTQKIAHNTGGFGTLADYAEFGGSIASIGDLNHDGIPDLAVGTWADDTGGENNGAAYVLFMNSDGTVNSTQKIAHNTGGFGALDGDNFGFSIAGIGDLNRDGILDLAVGAHWNSTVGTARGAVYVLLMNVDGTVGNYQKIAHNSSGLGILSDFDQFGSSVTGIGDLNRDGILDLAVGTPGDTTGGTGRGAIYILFMNTDGTVSDYQKIAHNSGGFGSLADGDRFGISVANIGDLNYDGISDLAVGAHRDDTGGSSTSSNRGAIYVLFTKGIPPVSDLSMSKSVTPTNNVAYHGTITYTIVLSNAGTGDDAAVLLTDTLSDKVVFDNWVEWPVGALVNDGEVTWSGTLTANHIITLVFRATHIGNYGDTVTNTARYSGTLVAGSDDAIFTVEPVFCIPATEIDLSLLTSGPIYTDTVVQFGVDVLPGNATRPYTYTVDLGDGTVPVTMTGNADLLLFDHIFITPDTYTVNVAIWNCTLPPLIDHRVVVVNSTAGPEPDDTCAQANFITTDGVSQLHTFYQYADKDWVRFDAVSGTTYLIEAQVPLDSPADVILQVYDICDGAIQDDQDYAFSPGVRLKFKATADGTIFFKLLNHDPAVYGTHVVYHLSVRELDDTPMPGAVVIVAGKIRDGDALQSNIHYVTNAAYRLFVAQGYDNDRIYYLATDVTLDPDGDGISDVDGVPTFANLRQAVLQWAVDKVRPDRPLTLYLTDHGGYDKFYLNGSSQIVSPNDINNWLDVLETAVPGVEVNIIVEACQSGSFIDLAQTVSKAGRLLITSTGAWNLAWSVPRRGAAFSDPFLQALVRGMSLYGSFEQARWAVEAEGRGQTPWLDDDGDGIPNRGQDGLEAMQRSYVSVETLGEHWSPWVVWAAIRGVQDGQGMIEAEVRDDGSVSAVWAVIYPPSYEPSTSGEELVAEDLPVVMLADDDGDGVYGTVYDAFDEAGAYRVVVYAVDDEGLVGRPNGATGVRIYLPLVIK